MDPVIIIAGFILFAMSIYLVGSPLFRKGDAPEFDWDLVDEIPTREMTKEMVFTALAEIEFDYQMGKMGEDDYNELKQKYQPRAVELLQAEEKVVIKHNGPTMEIEVEKELEEELERELAEMRRQVDKGRDG